MPGLCGGPCQTAPGQMPRSSPLKDLATEDPMWEPPASTSNRECRAGPCLGRARCRRLHTSPMAHWALKHEPCQEEPTTRDPLTSRSPRGTRRIRTNPSSTRHRTNRRNSRRCLHWCAPCSCQGSSSCRGSWPALHSLGSRSCPSLFTTHPSRGLLRTRRSPTLTAGGGSPETRSRLRRVVPSGWEHSEQHEALGAVHGRSCREPEANQFHRSNRTIERLAAGRT